MEGAWQNHGLGECDGKARDSARAGREAAAGVYAARHDVVAHRDKPWRRAEAGGGEGK